MSGKFPPGNPSPFGRNLRQTRLRRELTQRRLAEIASVGQTTIADLEAGRIHYAGVMATYAIAVALGERIEDLMAVPRVEHTTKGRSHARAKVRAP